MKYFNIIGWIALKLVQMMSRGRFQFQILSSPDVFMFMVFKTLKSMNEKSGTPSGWSQCINNHQIKLQFMKAASLSLTNVGFSNQGLKLKF